MVEPTEDGGENTPQKSPSENTARFYFDFTFRLANRDLTKFAELNKMNLYLCLNAASLIKDEIVAQQNEIRKIQSRTKEVR